MYTSHRSKSALFKASVSARRGCTASRKAPSCRHPGVAARSELPKELQEARAVKRVGLLSSSLLVGTALLVSLTYRIVPSLSEEFIRGLAWGLCGLAGCSVVALRSNKVLAEFHQGRLYLQFDVPYENGSALPEGGVQVRPAKGKGNGAFATQAISKGTFLGEYEGTLLDEATYWQRYPNGVADYCMGIDREWTIDAAEIAKDTSKFSACHINHSSQSQNVSRRCIRAQRKVLLFTARDIQEGEELLLDYGKVYWTGREDQIIEG